MEDVAMIDFPFNSIEEFTFESKAQPVSASLRPIYRIALICFVLKNNCRANTASLFKLQFFNWLIKSPVLQQNILKDAGLEKVFTLDLIHLDPMVNLALRYAFADDLVTITRNAKYKLTEKGLSFADRIQREGSAVLTSEKGVLLKIGKQVSEVQLKGELL